MFAEEVGFGFFAEVGFDDAAFGAAIGCGVRQGDVAGFAAFILVNGNQRRHAAAFQKFAAYGVAGAFGSNHNHVQIGTRHDLVVVDVEAVGESQYRALFQVRLDFVFVHDRLVFVGQQNHHYVCFFGGIGHGQYFETGRFCFFPRTALAQADYHLHTRIFQVGSVGVALRTVADDGDGFTFNQGQVGVFIVINLHCFSFSEE